MRRSAGSVRSALDEAKATTPQACVVDLDELDSGSLHEAEQGLVERAALPVDAALLSVVKGRAEATDQRIDLQRFRRAPRARIRTIANVTCRVDALRSGLADDDRSLPTPEEQRF